MRAASAPGRLGSRNVACRWWHRPMRRTVVARRARLVYCLRSVLGAATESYGRPADSALSREIGVLPPGTGGAGTCAPRAARVPPSSSCRRARRSPAKPKVKYRGIFITSTTTRRPFSRWTRESSSAGSLITTKSNERVFVADRSRLTAGLPTSGRRTCGGNARYRPMSDSLSRQGCRRTE
jgi:hypothetical protein